MSIENLPSKQMTPEGSNVSSGTLSLFTDFMMHKIHTNLKRVFKISCASHATPPGSLLIVCWFFYKHSTPPGLSANICRLSGIISVLNIFRIL
jgi:hypothetical protein